MSSTSSSKMLSPPTSVKRVRFSPETKDSDDVVSSSSRSSSPVIPRTPRRPINSAGWQLPSPALSDVSSVALEEELLVHSLLLPPSASQRIVYDIRTHPVNAYFHSQQPYPLSPHFASHATQPALKRVQLISKYLPWTIVVENPSGVTIGDILYRIHTALNKTVRKEEYEAIKDEKAQGRILHAYKKNCTPTPGLPARTKEEGLKRIDWLAECTYFSGIQKDMAYLAARVPDARTRAETFVVEFTAA